MRVILLIGNLEDADRDFIGTLNSLEHRVQNLHLFASRNIAGQMPRAKTIGPYWPLDPTLGGNSIIPWRIEILVAILPNISMKTDWRVYGNQALMAITIALINRQRQSTIVVTDRYDYAAVVDLVRPRKPDLHAPIVDRLYEKASKAIVGLFGSHGIDEIAPEQEVAHHD
ncbi:MAG: hypothetical protein WCT02_01915 [Candidatus Paceibacterota bacterium]